jgi:transketolase
MSRITGPTLLALCRQNLPNLTQFDVTLRREGVLKGGNTFVLSCLNYLTSTPGYILQKETGPLKVILISTGSELNVAVEAAKRLGDGVRVVSMPSTYRFDQQPAEYREEVLPSAMRKVFF